MCKSALRIGLLLFVAASIVAPLVRGIARPRDAALADIAPSQGDAVVVLYLCSRYSCPACRTLEACSRAVVEQQFATENIAGTILWKAIDFQTSANEHFLDDFELPTGGVVLVEFRGGKLVRHKALLHAWNLTEDRAALARISHGGNQRLPGAPAMNPHEPSAAVAFALGLWSAVQPCPMTANLAAIAWLGRRAGSMRGGLAAALLFVAGQTIAYVTLAWLILESIASSWRLSIFLQRHVNEILGPMWILAAMVLLRLLDFRLPRLNVSGTLRVPTSNGTRSVPDTLWFALPLGILLALAFCP